jgi:hypothetical protein
LSKLIQPYEEGEEVLVESKSGQYLWDAQVIEVSTKKGDDARVTLIDAYRVQYTGWSSCYIEWVSPKRVVEPNDNNKLLQVRSEIVHKLSLRFDVLFIHCSILIVHLSQEELLDELAISKPGLPTSLNILNAKDFIFARDRVRGQDQDPLPDFALIAMGYGYGSSKCSNDNTFATMKAAALAIEAALPLGSVDTTPNGLWNPNTARQWRIQVRYAVGPAELMRCVILLEDAITVDWIKEDVGHLRSCLPARWKAIGEASPSGLAVRIILLDRSIKYSTVDRKRFAPRKRKN